MFSKRRLPNHSPRSTWRRKLRLESLCARVVFDGAGLGVSDPLPWFDPGTLTFSYAPDGTEVAGQQNSLFATLAGLATESVWKQEFESAFAAWLDPLGAHLSESADSGESFGIAGRTQGDTRFGDIRIAAVPLSNSVLATSVPHSAIAQGTWAGDILLNSDAQWDNLETLFTVVLHEMGHVLGLPHSSDPDSVMFRHGIQNVSAPSQADIDWLRDLYAGVKFEDAEGNETDSEASTVTFTDTTGAFDPSSAIVLAPAVSSAIRYSANGNVVDLETPVVFRLAPTPNPAKDLENLTITLHPTSKSRLVADIKVLDASGRTVESQVLHHSHGDVVVQAQGIEDDQPYYIVVNQSQTIHDVATGGAFELIVDLSPELRRSRHAGDVELDHETPILEQSFSVPTPRLLHVHLVSEGNINLDNSIVAQLVDHTDQVLSQTWVNSGESRSAPLTFLPAGDYRIRFIHVGGDSESSSVAASVYLDDLSLDVGPPVVDPTGTPYLPCDEPGADPLYCYSYGPVSTYPPYQPIDPVSFYPESYPWWYEYDFACSDYAGQDLENAQTQDPLWWEFYLGQCADPGMPPSQQPTLPTDPGNDPSNSGSTNGATTGSGPTENGTPIQQGSPLQNSVYPFDVSGDNVVSPSDALLVINEISLHGSRNAEVINAFTSYYVDVNGDLFITPIDALLIINSLARQLNLPEGESAPLSRTQADLSIGLNQNLDVAIGQLF